MDFPTRPNGLGQRGVYNGALSAFGTSNLYQGAPSITVPVESWTSAVSTTNASTHFNFACVPLAPGKGTSFTGNPQLDRLGLYQNFGFCIQSKEVTANEDFRQYLRNAEPNRIPSYGIKKQKIGPMKTYTSVERRSVQFEEPSIMLNAAAVNFVLASHCAQCEGDEYNIPDIHTMLDMIRPIGVCVNHPRDLNYGKDELDVRAFCLSGPVDIHDVFGGTIGKKNFDMMSARYGKKLHPSNPYGQVVKGTPLYYVLIVQKVTDEEKRQMTFKFGNGGEEKITQYPKNVRWVVKPWMPLDGTMRAPRAYELIYRIRLPDREIHYSGHYWKIGIVHEPPKRYDITRTGFTPYDIGTDDMDSADRCPLMSIFVDFIGAEFTYYSYASDGIDNKDSKKKDGAGTKSSSSSSESSSSSSRRGSSTSDSIVPSGEEEEKSDIGDNASDTGEGVGFGTKPDPRYGKIAKEVRQHKLFNNIFKQDARNDNVNGEKRRSSAPSKTALARELAKEPFTGGSIGSRSNSVGSESEEPADGQGNAFGATRERVGNFAADVAAGLKRVAEVTGLITPAQLSVLGDRKGLLEGDNSSDGMFIPLTSNAPKQKLFYERIIWNNTKPFFNSKNSDTISKAFEYVVNDIFGPIRDLLASKFGLGSGADMVDNVNAELFVLSRYLGANLTDLLRDSIEDINKQFSDQGSDLRLSTYKFSYDKDYTDKKIQIGILSKQKHLLDYCTRLNGFLDDTNAEIKFPDTDLTYAEFLAHVSKCMFKGNFDKLKELFDKLEKDQRTDAGSGSGLLARLFYEPTSKRKREELLKATGIMFADDMRWYYNHLVDQGYNDSTWLDIVLLGRLIGKKTSIIDEECIKAIGYFSRIGPGGLYPTYTDSAHIRLLANTLSVFVRELMGLKSPKIDFPQMVDSDQMKRAGMKEQVMSEVNINNLVMLIRTYINKLPTNKDAGIEGSGDSPNITMEALQEYKFNNKFDIVGGFQMFSQDATFFKLFNLMMEIKKGCKDNLNGPVVTLLEIIYCLMYIMQHEAIESRYKQLLISFGSILTKDEYDKMVKFIKFHPGNTIDGIPASFVEWMNENYLLTANEIARRNETGSDEAIKSALTLYKDLLDVNGKDDKLCVKASEKWVPVFQSRFGSTNAGKSSDTSSPGLMKSISNGDLLKRVLETRRPPAESTADPDKSDFEEGRESPKLAAGATTASSKVPTANLDGSPEAGQTKVPPDNSSSDSSSTEDPSMLRSTLQNVAVKAAGIASNVNKAGTGAGKAMAGVSSSKP